jgi:hypothetical protein|tara:strand:+ start:1092 stop:1415 length:324 start_codon:yes stop_codon:yes gene_type:complete
MWNMSVFYDDNNITRAEYKKSLAHWKKVARNEFTRGQIVQTAAGNLDLCSPVWNAMQFELLHRDQLDASRMMNRELKSAIKGESPYGISTVVKRKKRTRKSLKRKGK